MREENSVNFAREAEEKGNRIQRATRLLCPWNFSFSRVRILTLVTRPPWTTKTSRGALHHPFPARNIISESCSPLISRGTREPSDSSNNKLYLIDGSSRAALLRQRCNEIRWRVEIIARIAGIMRYRSTNERHFSLHFFRTFFPSLPLLFFISRPLALWLSLRTRGYFAICERKFSFFSLCTNCATSAINCFQLDLESVSQGFSKRGSILD